MKYLDEAPFAAQSITVVPFRAPTTGMCSSGCQVSALWTLATRGPAAPADRLRILAGARTAMEGAA